MLYADDTFIMAETTNDLQNALDAYNSNCTNWKLTINTTKSKIVVFSKARPSNFNFTLNNQPLETVNQFKYLGVLFRITGISINTTKNFNRHILPIYLQIDLLNNTMKPQLLYGAAIWGNGNLAIIEMVNLNF